jgi:uncharacterized membrane protein YkvA (DUF1232 family)
VLWRLLLAVLGGLLVSYVILLVALWRGSRGAATADLLREALRLLPDLVRLVRDLARDPTLPRGTRWRAAGLLLYLLSPIDLVPDVIPVLGYADDALVVALVLRSVVRSCGADAVDRLWSGTSEGLRVVHRLAGIEQPVS